LPRACRSPPTSRVWAASGTQPAGRGLAGAGAAWRNTGDRRACRLMSTHCNQVRGQWKCKVGCMLSIVCI
jgi:hypothetical protein